jgi:hypothetical protein
MEIYYYGKRDGKECVLEDAGKFDAFAQFRLRRGRDRAARSESSRASDYATIAFHSRKLT